MSCTLYVQRSEGRIKIVFGRVLLFGENATAHGIPLLHDKVKIIVEDCKHVIISFPTDNKKWIGGLIQTPFIWPIGLVYLVEPVIN
jgi:hypothetical protein